MNGSRPLKSTWQHGLILKLTGDMGPSDMGHGFFIKSTGDNTIS